MKNLFNNTANGFDTIHEFPKHGYSIDDLTNFKIDRHKRFAESNSKPRLNKESLLTPNAIFQMATGQIPDLWNICLELANTFYNYKAPYSAIQFVPVMQQVQPLNKKQVSQFLKNPETRQVLVDNDLIRIVLIHWKPGKVSNIHGHPKGGCVFKVLQGKLEELRHAPDPSHKLLSSSTYRAGSMAYIDDKMGFHQVGNPYGSSAISLHVYTPGNEK